MNKTKRAIYNASIEVFSRLGYNKATMELIAEAANVSKGTLYYHFKNKEEIFNFIIYNGMKSIVDRVKELAEKEDNIYIQVRDILKHQIKIMCERKEFFKVIMSQIWGEEERQIQLRKAVQDYLKIIEFYLNKAMEHNHIKEYNCELLSYTVFGILSSTAIYDVLSPNSLSTEEITEQLMKLIFKGITIGK